MPIFYYISFSYNKKDSTLSIKDLTDLKPLKDPHLCFSDPEIKFLIGGQWDIWIRPVIKNNTLKRIEKEINCNIATSHQLPELYNMLRGYAIKLESEEKLEPEEKLKVKVEKLRQEYLKLQ